MVRPDGIPEDVWNASVTAVATAYDEGEATITVARAILAERERCVQIAEACRSGFRKMADVYEDDGYVDMATACKAVASEIKGAP
jgi:hypothetical protein